MSRRARWNAALAAVALLVAAVAVTGGLSARAVARGASSGKALAEAGVRSLAAQDATTAASQFAAASQSFATARRSLGPPWFVSVGRRIPWVGSQFTAAETLLDVGIDCSAAGADLSEAFRAGSDDSVERTSPAGGFARQIASDRKHVDAAISAMSAADTRVASLSADGLVPPLASAVESAKSTLGQAAPYLGRARALVQLASYLFSSDHRLIVASQDGAEIRPTGGFVGSYGIVDVGDTGARLEAYRNVYSLPQPPGIITPPPGAVMTRDFSFRDANWWIDFPTSARAMLGLWSSAHQPNVDGIVAIDTVAMRSLLTVTGPITVPGYSEPFTSANLLDRLLYLVEVKNKYVVMAKKDVVVTLAGELESRLMKASPAELGRAAMALGRSADGKHVQMFFTDPDAQTAVEALGWSGSATMPRGSTDIIAVSNAMNEPGKVNVAMRKAIDYRVRLLPDGSAETTLVLSYSNTGPYPMPLPSRFLDWLRVYRAPSTLFDKTTPGGSATKTMVEFGLPAEVRSFALLRHQSHVETLVARIPGAVRDSGATPGGAVYRLHVVRQDDLVDVPLTVTVTAPSGWRTTAATASLSAAGTRLPVTNAPEGVRLAVPLSGDLDLVVLLARR